MYSLDDIIDVHLEITTKCNAGCPMCPRHEYHTSKVRDHIGLIDIDLEKAKKILQPSLIKNLRTMLLCGNYGDAIANPQLIPIIEYIRSINSKIRITLLTNGGARNIEFWKKIAQLVDSVHFGIDGLSDTNHLYRQFVNWDILERNVKTYTMESIKLKKKKHSTWVMNVFKHNEHQIEDAKKIAKLWGINNFRERYTRRFTVISETKKGELNEWPVYDDNGGLKHTLEPSTINRAKNAVENFDILSNIDNQSNIDITKVEFTQELLDSYNKLYENFDIDCMVNKNKSIYIDYQGKVFPCCWFGQSSEFPESIMDMQVKKMYEKYGEDFNNLTKHSIESIFDSGIFEEVEMGMKHKNISCGNTIVCTRWCSKKTVGHKLIETDLF